MDPRKMLRWVSHHGGGRSIFRSQGSPQSGVSDGKATIEKASKEKWLSGHTVLEPPTNVKVQCKERTVSRSTSLNLLARRGILQSKQDLLTIQPNRRPKAMPVVDPDFFDETPTTAIAKLEKLSSVPPGSPCRPLTSDQVEEMLKMLTRDRFIGEETPVCESTPKACLWKGSQEAHTKRSSDRRDATKPRSENSTGTSPSLCQDRPPGRIGFSNGASKTNIMRLEDLSQVSLDEMTPLMRLNASMVHIDKVFETCNTPLKSVTTGQASTIRSESSTVRGGTHVPPSKCSQSRKAEVSDAQGFRVEYEDPFLYLAWTSMPKHARCSWPRGPRKVANKPCAMPTPQLEIVAAESRISAFKSSPLACQLSKDMKTISADTGVAGEMHEDIRQAKTRILEASKTANFHAYLTDSVFVRMYADEMKARCKMGVWWEGWRIIEDLKRKGVIGSDCATS